MLLFRRRQATKLQNATSPAEKARTEDSPVRASLLHLSSRGARHQIVLTTSHTSSGKQTAVTIIEAGPCVVTQKKTVETDGYNALQVAFGDKKEKHSNKAAISHFAKAQTSPKKVVREIRDSEIDKAVGESITVDIFAEGDSVAVVGTTKGKGFQWSATVFR